MSTLPANNNNDMQALISTLQQLTHATSRIAGLLEQHSLLQGNAPATAEDGQTALADFSEAQQLLAQSPIAPLLRDDAITDILINGPQEIYISRDNKLEKTPVTFPNPDDLMALAQGIAHSVKRGIDPHRPLVDARLKDGSRVNIIAPPMAVGGLSMSIRKFPKKQITLDMLVANGSLTQQMADFLKVCAECKVNILISGGTGTGKTTMLNAISHFIPETERIITIEDTAELHLQQPHVVRLETKEPAIFGNRAEEVNTSDLLRNALRMRPDRIIVGEVRGPEAYDMIQAMNTGHEGSMATVHANTPRDALARIENMLGPVMQNTPIASVRRQIISAINIIIQLSYNDDGKRRVVSITDVIGMEGETPTSQEIFHVKEDTLTEPGKILYELEWNNIMPHHHKLALATRERGIFPVTPM